MLILVSFLNYQNLYHQMKNKFFSRGIAEGIMASMPFSLSLVVSCPDHGTGPFFFCAASFTIYLPCGLSIHFLSHGASD